MFQNLKSIPLSIWSISLAGCFVNMSGVMLFTVVPFYLIETFGVTLKEIGYFSQIDGLSWVMRTAAGTISDYFSKRKMLLNISYIFLLIGRYLVAWTGSVHGVGMGQALGSLGNGLQASPREALVGDCAPPHLKGSCYGLRQTLTVSGSIIGSLILIIMEYRSSQPLDYLFVLRLSLYPMILAFLILLFAVKDAAPSSAAQIPAKERKPFHLSQLKELPADYWVLVVIAGIFMCANYHGNFLLIHCREGGWTASWVMLVQNIATFLTAFPIGELSDKWGRDRLLLIGMSLTLFANTALAFPSQWGSLWIGLGVMLWGAQVGIVQSLILAKIADRCPAALKGTAFGFYYLSIGAGFYIANKVAGTVSQAFSLPAVFEASNVFVVLSMTLLSIQILKNRRRKI